MPENELTIGGWKTKTGSALLALGGVLTGATEVVPIPEWIPWLKFAGYIIAGIGGSFVAWGIGHKISKLGSITEKCGD